MLFPYLSVIDSQQKPLAKKKVLKPSKLVLHFHEFTIF